MMQSEPDPEDENDEALEEVAPAARSGTKWSEKDYASKGYKRIVLRVPAATAEAFEEIAQALTQGNRSKAFAQIVDTLSKKRK